MASMEAKLLLLSNLDVDRGLPSGLKDAKDVDAVADILKKYVQVSGI